MHVNDFEQQSYMDLFADAATATPPPQQTAPKFGSERDKDTNLFDTPPQPDPATPATTAPATGEGAPKPPIPGEEDKDIDLIGEGEDDKEPKQGGRPPKYNFSDTSGYFEDRFKSGKFVAVEEVDTEGNKIAFIPKTPEEFDEVIDIQVDYKVQEKIKELEDSWYQSKSPSWQMVAKYAEMTDNPEDILPFLQGVRTFDSVAKLDPEDISHAERIVRERLTQRGDDEDIINETVESLKATDKLVSTAQKYKPLILNQEKQQLQTMVAEKRREEEEYNKIVHTVRESAIKAIESPFIGKSKLKQEEKAVIYDLIAEPSRETKGYPIYAEIDRLFESGDFDTLKQIALLVSKKEAYLNYVQDNAADKTATSLQKKLRIAAENGSGGRDSTDTGGRPPVQRNQYSKTPHFGR